MIVGIVIGITSDVEIKDGSYLCIAICDGYCKVIDSNCDLFTIYFNNSLKRVINKIALYNDGELVIETWGDNKVIVASKREMFIS
jgi:hypothetical protein